MGEPKGKGREAKRQRVSRACNRCRVARQKCDGKRPCSTCATAQIDCTYETGTKRRGIPSGYIRTVELALSWCMFNVAGCEDSLKHLIRTEAGRKLLSGSNGERASQLHNKWRNTVIFKGIDRLLSGADSILDDDDEEDEHTSSDIALDAPDTGNRENIDNSIVALEGFSFPGSGLSHDSPSLTVFSSKYMPKPRLPSNFSQLIDIYFAYTHCWLPIVSKETILKLCYTYPEDGLDLILSSPGSGSYAELWGILAIASFQTQFTRGSSSGMTAKQMMSISESLIPKDAGVFENGHASALLLMTLYHIGTEDFASAWVSVGLAIRVVLLLRQKSIISGTKERQERLNTLLLACFVLETFLSVQHNTTPHLRIEDMPPYLLSEEGLDEWQPWTPCPDFAFGENENKSTRSTPMLSHSTFNQLVRLSYVLSDALWTQKTTVEDALLDWIRQMPPKIRGLYSISDNEPTPHRLNLLLAYLVAKALCDPSDRQIAIDKALSVFEVYFKTMGHFATPPTFTLFTSLLQRNEPLDSIRRQHLGDIKSQARLVWSTLQPREATNSSTQTISPQLTARFASESQHSHQLQPSILQTIPSLESNAQQIYPLDMPPITPQSLYDGSQLEPSASTNLMDLDALFDDLASFEGERHSNPEFMQNLGFAADATLTDLMTGGFDWSYTSP